MLKLDHAAISEQGNVRFKNEDNVGHNVPPDARIVRAKGSIFMVADGVGGHGGGDLASREAVEHVIKTYYEDESPPMRALLRAFAKANMHVFDRAIEINKFRMQTTLSAIALVGASSYIVHAGDSRIYRIRGPRDYDQLTRDDSEVAELVRMRIVAPENVRSHPRRNIVTRTLGAEPVVKPMSRIDAVAEGDVFVMCTDGLWEPVEDHEIAEIAWSEPPEDACRKLIDLGIERQSKDNLSVQIVRVLRVGEELHRKSANNEPWWKRLFSRNGNKPDPRSENPASPVSVNEDLPSPGDVNLKCT
ncbi:MAG: PP2C family protein-serine/threonine phosphatase [Capsulimonadaceae bacterium]